MNLTEIASRLSLDVRTAKEYLDQEVTGCYISDLLSDVMARAQEGDVWITHQVHPNIVAVAVLKNVAAIIITDLRTPEEETLRKAAEEHLPVAVTPLGTFEAGGLLYQMLRC